MCSFGECAVSQPAFILSLPDWLEEFVSNSRRFFPTPEERMSFVIELSRLNVLHRGGPFAAAIFCMEDGSLLAPGVNLVLSGGCSVLHGEIVALMAAQMKIGDYDLSSPGSRQYELVTSTEPCAMCLGAITWSGVRQLVCGARGSDAEDTGFDEGEKPPRWAEGLERRGISVVRDVCREQASAVLREYQASGGVIYNPRRNTSAASK
jgi:tRNA(Arg) A34 adenosine deaminase TadA